MNGSPGKKPTNPFHCSVPDDVVDVVAALAVRSVGANAVDVALHRLTGGRVIEGDRQTDAPAGDLDVVLGGKLRMQGAQLLEQIVDGELVW